MALPGGAVLKMPGTPGHLPFSGGMADQPACVIAAFHLMDAADAALQAAGVEED